MSSERLPSSVMRRESLAGRYGLIEHVRSVQHPTHADRMAWQWQVGASSAGSMLNVLILCSEKNAGPAKAEFDFSSGQPWVKTQRNLTFLDEAQELISIYDHAAEPEIDYPIVVEAQKEVTGGHTTPAVEVSSRQSNSPAPGNKTLSLDQVDSSSYASFSDLSSPTKRRRLTFNSDSYHASPTSQVQQSPTQAWQASPHSGWTPAMQYDPVRSADVVGFGELEQTISNVTANYDTIPDLTQTYSHGQQSYTAVSDSLSRIYLETSVWPLQSSEEARLLRYYVEHLARNFDLTDPLQHFRSVVPQRAATCPTLLNAIFALSARHLSRVGKYDPLISNRYHQECLTHLIPMLDDTTAILDENLLASTIILRHLEEIEVPLSGQSPASQQSHLLGAHAFITAQERATITGGLRLAAFWVGLRQEIYVAFVNQRSIIPLEHSNLDRSFDAATDDVWACRIVVLLADVIRHCFGDSDQSQTTYAYLTDMVARWHDSKPPSFTPVFQRPANLEDGQIFPELWFVGDEVLVGLQHYHLARILLASHNPRIPRLGLGRAAALKAMDEEIRDHVRALCGMALSNPSTPPNFTSASMGVTMAGDKFADRREQEALLDVLERCDKVHAWPTGDAVANLREAWGWKAT
ncbi:hypothetical protein LTR56_021339 [Elasticomyces elasticus]|nr:hypothetical protein LTR56_021339 [Elasticomyces elasticus]